MESKPRRMAFRQGRLAFFSFPNLGAFFAVTPGSRQSLQVHGPRISQPSPRHLFFCPMLADRTPDKDNLGPVESVETQAEVDEINHFFRTDFSLEDWR